MTHRKLRSSPGEQTDLFILFDMDHTTKLPTAEDIAPAPSIRANVEVHPMEAPVLAESPAEPLVTVDASQPQRTALPKGWTEEDIRFLLEKLAEGPLLVADTDLGIPTIHSNFGKEAEHRGFGLFVVRGEGYELDFDAGGAMARTPSGNGWTRLHISGNYHFDTEAVKAKLEEYLKSATPAAPANEALEGPAELVKEMISLEDQIREFHRNLAQFTGTTKWIRYPALCPHIVLLTEGISYLAEHGGEKGNSAYWLIDAIASYQGEAILKQRDFQFWKLFVHPSDLLRTEQNTAMAALEVKRNGVQEKHFNPRRHASLICTNGDEKELVRQEIEMTDFLPIGEVRIYASIEEHPDVSSNKKVMILLLPSEY